MMFWVRGQEVQTKKRGQKKSKSNQTGVYTRSGGFDFLSMGSLLDKTGDGQTECHRGSNHAQTGHPNVRGGTHNESLSLSSLQNELCSVLGIDPTKLPGSGQTSSKGNQLEDMDLQTILGEAADWNHPRRPCQ